MGKKIKSVLKSVILLAFISCLIFIMSCAPKKDGDKSMVLRMGLGDIETMDTAKLSAHFDMQILMQIMEGLTSYHPETFKPVPGAAESWTISDDFKVFTFKLRKAAKWSDGKPVTANDFEYAWKRILTPETGSPYSYILADFIKGGNDFLGGSGKWEDVGVKVLDEYTLEVTTQNSCPFFLDLTSFAIYYPQPMHVVEEKGADWVKPGNFVGNGPFILTEYEPQTQVVVNKSSTYWDKGKVKLDKVIFSTLEDTETIYAKYLNNELDFVDTLPVGQVDSVKSTSEYFHGPNLAIYYYSINVTKAPFDDARVRKAVSMAIDRQDIIDNVTRGGQILALSFTPPGAGGYTPPLVLKEDIAAAKKLLADAGYPDGKGFPKFALTYNTSENHKAIAERIQQLWKDNLGIECALENQEWKVFLNTRRDGNFQIARNGWNGDYNDPNTFLDLFTTGNPQNDSQWSNTDYDAYIKAAATEGDPDKRFNLFFKAETLMLEDSIVIPLYFYATNAVKKPYVKGLYVNTKRFYPLKEAYIEKMEK